MGVLKGTADGDEDPLLENADVLASKTRFLAILIYFPAAKVLHDRAPMRSMAAIVHAN